MAESPRSLRARLWVLFRSSLVGLLATASDLLSLVLLIHVVGLTARVANVPSLLPGLVIMFVGNKFFAFEDRSRAVVRQGAVFLVIEAVAFGLNVLLFDLLVTHTTLHEVLARLVGTNVTYLGFSFPMWSWLVFRRRTPSAPELDMDPK